jgi:hypothetical protein
LPRRMLILYYRIDILYYRTDPPVKKPDLSIITFPVLDLLTLLCELSPFNVSRTISWLESNSNIIINFSVLIRCLRWKSDESTD